MRSKALMILITVALSAIMIPGTATASHPDRLRDGEVIDSPLEVDHLHDDMQHGEPGDHLPGSSENVELVGQADIEGAAPDRVADVSAFGNYAYLTVRDPVGCFDAGVAIFDISDPTNPVQVGFIDATEGSLPGEGSQVVHVDTRYFSGEILVFNNEICATGGEGGVSLWDVTDPLNPTPLTEHTGDDDPPGVFGQVFHTIHSSFAWDAGKRAFVVIVDNEETADVDIIEITDPTNPVFLTELNMNDFGVLQPNVLGQASFLHDMIVKRINNKWVMLLSYWDGGWLILDVTDPANPVLLRDFTYPDPDTLTGVSPPEGNAHQAEFSPDGEFIIGTDEDFSPYRIDPFMITTGPNAGEEFDAGEFGWTVPIAQAYPDNMVNGPTIWGGTGCPEDVNGNGISDREEVPPASELEAEEGEEKIVVFIRGFCFFSEKVESGQLAGYDVVIIGNHHEGAGGGETPDAAVCGSMGHEFEVTVSAICIGHRALHLLFNDEPQYLPLEDDENPFGFDLPPIGTLGEEISATVLFDGWGYVRLLSTRTFEEIDAYAIDESLDPAFAFGFGDLSVHEVAVDPWIPGLAYLSYYSGGLRVITYGPEGITEVGHYIDEEGNDFWGVEAHRLPGRQQETLILASDRDSGLWIFRYTGPLP